MTRFVASLTDFKMATTLSDAGSRMRESLDGCQVQHGHQSGGQHATLQAPEIEFRSRDQHSGSFVIVLLDLLVDCLNSLFVSF